MVNLKKFRKIALAFPEANELPHFEKSSFRVGKKIFATYNVKEKRACLKLNEIDQDVFSAFNNRFIHPVPNRWGKMGWTLFYLEQVPESLLIDALNTAYCNVAPKKLSLLLKAKTLV